MQCEFILISTNKSYKYNINLNLTVKKCIEVIENNILTDFYLQKFNLYLKNKSKNVKITSDLNQKLINIIQKNNINLTDNLIFYIIPQHLSNDCDDSVIKQCPICFEKKILIRFYKCNHHGFCKQCFKNWKSALKNNINNCPVCRKEVKENYKNYSAHEEINIINNFNNRIISDFIPNRIQILNDRIINRHNYFRMPKDTNTGRNINRGRSISLNHNLVNALLPYYNPSYIRNRNNHHNYRRNNFFSHTS